MYKMAVLGDYDSIYGFATLGLDTFPVTDPAEAAKELHRYSESRRVRKHRKGRGGRQEVRRAGSWL